MRRQWRGAVGARGLQLFAVARVPNHLQLEQAAPCSLRRVRGDFVQQGPLLRIRAKNKHGPIQVPSVEWTLKLLSPVAKHLQRSRPCFRTSSVVPGTWSTSLVGFVPNSPACSSWKLSPGVRMATYLPVMIIEASLSAQCTPPRCTNFFCTQ